MSRKAEADFVRNKALLASTIAFGWRRNSGDELTVVKEIFDGSDADCIVVASSIVNWKMMEPRTGARYPATRVTCGLHCGVVRATADAPRVSLTREIRSVAHL